MPFTFTPPEIPIPAIPALPKSNISPGLQAIQDKKKALKEKMGNMSSQGKDALSDVASGLSDLKEGALSSIPPLPVLPDFATEAQNLINIPTLPSLDSFSSQFGAGAADSLLSQMKSGVSIDIKSIIPPGKVAAFPDIPLEKPNVVKKIQETIKGIKAPLNIKPLE